jgi:hypothetical protein
MVCRTRFPLAGIRLRVRRTVDLLTYRVIFPAAPSAAMNVLPSEWAMVLVGTTVRLPFGGRSVQRPRELPGNSAVASRLRDQVVS